MLPLREPFTRRLRDAFGDIGTSSSSPVTVGMLPRTAQSEPRSWGPNQGGEHVCRSEPLVSYLP